LSLVPEKLNELGPIIPALELFVLMQEGAGDAKQTPLEPILDLTLGPNTVFLRSENDLPAPSGGFITLKQNTEYIQIKRFDYSTPILVPAGWNGVFSAFAYQTNRMRYLGIGAAVRTLNIQGTVTDVINSPANPGTHITIIIGANTLQDGQYVNLVDMTVSDYDGVALLISNRTATTIDVEISFNGNATGTFDTGVAGFDHNSFVLVGDGTNEAFDISISKAPNSSVKLLNSGTFGFNNIGTIRNGIVVADVYGTSSLENGLVLENCDTGNVGGILHENLNPASTTAIGLTITGALTRALALDKYRALMKNSLQRACRVDNSVINASISLIRCSHEVATRFFDEKTSGLDQNNPQILANNNDTIESSMASMQMGLTVDPITSTIIVSGLVQDVPKKLTTILFISSNLKRATVSNTGRITNLTEKTQQYSITFRGLMEKTAPGGSTNIGLLLVKNDVLNLSETFQIPRSVNAGITEVSATRNFELAKGEFLDPAVVNFKNETATISITQISVEYSEPV